MSAGRILTPAARLRYDAEKLRERGQGLAVEAHELLVTSKRGNAREIYGRIIRMAERLGQVAAALEQIADELTPEPETIPRYTFGVTRAADDPIP